MATSVLDPVIVTPDDKPVKQNSTLLKRTFIINISI